MPPDPALASTFRAPDGLELLQHNPRETRFVYKEIFEDRIYLRHGIALGPGAVVVDVGANIGLFTMFVKETRPDSRVIAIEPCPPVFALLDANTARYGAAVQALNCGIAASDGDAVFTHYPDYSIMGGFHADAAADVQTLKAGIRNQWKERFPNKTDIDQRYAESMLQAILGRRQTYVCRLRPLSAVLHDTAVDAVDLLKIDTEGSELDVLSGIADEHWPHIAQIVLEIHNANGERTGPAVALLREKGFLCAVEEEDSLRGSGVVNCYARRPEGHPPADGRR
jgi:FkbM family methyltransferase